MADITPEERLKRQSDFLRKLANSKRLLICILVSQQEEDVNSLAKKVGLSQSALSQHLACLLQSDLVAVRKSAQFRYYSCKHPGVLHILSALEQIYLPDGAGQETGEPNCTTHYR